MRSARNSAKNKRSRECSRSSAPVSVIKSLTEEINIVTRNVEVELRIELAHASWAGHINFSQIVTNDIKADEIEALFNERGPNLIANPTITIGECSPYAGATRGEIAPCFTGGGNSSQAIRHRLAIDHQNARVALSDLWDISLGHDELMTVLRQGFNDDIAIRVVGFQSKYRLSTHSI